MATKSGATVTTLQEPLRHRFAQWIQDPMGGVIAASVATIGSLGVVLSGSWLIHLIIN